MVALRCYRAKQIYERTVQMKRYQIFVSSTYDDLKAERSAVLESILKLRHIPVGMEQFVASNEEQFNYIKKLIDETDYYVLILGNRYGSISDSGISYTEKEFDYAASKKIPILAFVHGTPDSLPANKSEKSQGSKRQLEKFRDKVKSSRLVSLITWDSPASLSGEVVVALTNAFNDFPRPGWERVTSYDNSELLAQLNDLRIENNDLRTENIELKNKLEALTTSSNLSERINNFQWDETLCFIGRSHWDDYKDIEIPVNITWKQLISIWGSFIISKESTSLSHYALNHALFGDEEPYFCISDKDFQKMVVTFLRAGVIELAEDKVCLTDGGRCFFLNDSVSTDDLIKNTMSIVKSVKSKSSKQKREFQKYIEGLSNFNSNPEATNYIGETLIGVSVFLSKQNSLDGEIVNHAQALIKEILEEASADERPEMGAFDPIFNLAKILELTTILQKGMAQSE